MIISLHLPKTAGSSFARSLESCFGDRLLKDYADFPLNTPVFDRNRNALRAGIDNGNLDPGKIGCIHGHFLPLKYLLLSVGYDIDFVTWLRHPVERVLSHYYYWRRSYNPEHSRPLHRNVVEENWSVEKFCLSPALRNLYTQFLWGFPLEQFSFIGITEHYEHDLRYFSKRFIGKDLAVFEKTIGDRKEELYDIDSRFRQRIKSFHERDMALYHRALEFRRARPDDG